MNSNNIEIFVERRWSEMSLEIWVFEKKSDLRYLENPNFAYSATTISGNDFIKFRTNIG